MSYLSINTQLHHPGICGAPPQRDSPYHEWTDAQHKHNTVGYRAGCGLPHLRGDTVTIAE